MDIYKIPIGAVGEHFVNYLVEHFKPLFAAVEIVILFLNGWLKTALLFIPPWGVIAFVVILAWRLAGKTTSLFALIGLVFLWNLRIWEPTVVTLSLVITAACLSLIAAIPIGILMAESRIIASILLPALDFLQTMPRFIYLIPGVIIFGIDTVPGIIATMTLAIPPPVRLTALGLSQIDREVIEAGEAFGCNRWKLLCKVKLPLAMPSIMLGVNQCIMMSLSMVVIAAMIGAGGLGANILVAITRLRAGEGLEAGLGVVVTAIIIDRLCRGWIAKRKTRIHKRVAEV